MCFKFIPMSIVHVIKYYLHYAYDCASQTHSRNNFDFTCFYKNTGSAMARTHSEVGASNPGLGAIYSELTAEEVINESERKPRQSEIVL